MIDPAKNRLSDYEAGWLTLLVNARPSPAVIGAS